jgi:ring-1,2-phenylacetyl-CoA epoxidase subunit PaaD
MKETKTKISKEEIFKALEDVKDPEIPSVSLVDLGIVTDVNISGENFISITLTPTFSGCPALKVMETLVKEKLMELDVSGVEVKTSFDVQWNTNMITEKGLASLKKHGLAPPERHNGLVQIELLDHVKCPYCESRNTTLKSPFGPTLCRSLHYCSNCLQAFEQFKPVS